MNENCFLRRSAVLRSGKKGKSLLSVPFLTLFPIFPCFADGLRDIRGPVGLRPDGWWVLSLLLTILFLVLFFLFRGLSRNRKRPLPLSTPPRPEWILAYEAFDHLEKSSLIAEGRFKEYYALLSDAVRFYIERRFSIRAPEMTTEEFMETARISPGLSQRQKSFLRDFLDACDRVKFARFIPSLDEVKDSLRCARRFVDETRKGDGGDGI